jgi:hypothetical protein
VSEHAAELVTLGAGRRTGWLSDRPAPLGRFGDPHDIAGTAGYVTRVMHHIGNGLKTGPSIR